MVIMTGAVLILLGFLCMLILLKGVNLKIEVNVDLKESEQVPAPTPVPLKQPDYDKQDKVPSMDDVLKKVDEMWGDDNDE